jgi:hypothetical protein
MDESAMLELFAKRSSCVLPPVVQENNLVSFATRHFLCLARTMQASFLACIDESRMASILASHAALHCSTVGVSGACLVCVRLVWLAFACVWPRLFAYA